MHVYLLVFLSGAAALIYEVVWGRQLATFLGITSQAHTVVLATFMAGLALGSRLLGPRADRKEEPLRLFGWLEAGIGACALVGVWALPLVESAYAYLAAGRPAGGTGALLIRLSMATAVLLPPTFLMGGTLPALVRGLERVHSARRHQGLTRTIASIYGVNTLGAAAGAAAAGYLLLPRLGIRGTLFTAVTCNLLIAAVFLRPRPRDPIDPSADQTRTPTQEAADRAIRSSAGRNVLLAALALSGLAAMALQLAWVRALTLVLGSSVYAFSVTLATYLAGIALGSLLFARLRRVREPVAWAAGLETAVGLLALLGLPVIGRLPELFLAAYRAGAQESFASLQGVGVLLASSVILAPTLCLGALFPLLTALAASRADAVGRDVGRAAAANSIGTVVGIVTAGLFALPVLGVQGTVVGAAALHGVVGGWLWLERGRKRPAASLLRNPRFHVVVAAAVLLLLATAVPRWDPVVMTTGPFIAASRIVDVPEGETFREWIRRRNRLVYYAEGADGNVSVRDVGEERLLVINGKADGSRHGDRKTQLVVGHLPLLMHERPADVLMVGLGTGMTAGAAVAHEAIERLEVLEISPEVVEASQFFQDENKGVLFDPRLRLVIADARNHLRTTGKLYDVIISEPSNPWISGISNLFTREFFALALRHLAVGGVMSQWFHTYSMSEADLRGVLATYRSVFPYVTVWTPQLGDLVLIGGRTPHRLQLDRLAEVAATPRGILDLLPLDLLHPRGWARMYLLGPDELGTFTAGAPLNTDDRPRVEFNAPRNLYSETTLTNMRRLVGALEANPQPVPFAGLGGVDPETGRLQAFGLDISPPAGGWPDPGPRIDWQVSWTEVVAAAPGEDVPAAPSSSFAIGNRQVIAWEDVEIGCGPAAEVFDSGTLLEYLDGLAAGAIVATGATTLGDGTLAVWAESDGTPTERGLAWVCAQSTGPAGEPVRCALRRPASEHGLTALDNLAKRVRCDG